MNGMTDYDCVADIAVSADEVLVAFASQEGDIVDQHFGSAQGFFLYGVSAKASRLLACKQFGYEKKDGNEDKLKPRLSWLAGADVVYCGSIGGSATRQLLALGVNPVQVKGGPELEELLGDLQHQLSTSPEPWLATVLRKKIRAENDQRFDTMDDEGWEG